MTLGSMLKFVCLVAAAFVILLGINRFIRASRSRFFRRLGLGVYDREEIENLGLEFCRSDFAVFGQMTYERTLEVAFSATTLFLHFIGEKETYGLPYDSIAHRKTLSFKEQDRPFKVIAEKSSATFGFGQTLDQKLQRRISAESV
jgi:hypothetical protein